MQKILTFFLCCTLLRVVAAPPAGGPVYPASGIPAELKTGANAVVRNHEEVFTITGPGTATLAVTHAVTILSKSAVDFHSHAIVYFDNKLVKANILSVIAYDALGKEISRMKKSDIIEGSAVSGGTLYQDDKYKAVIAQSDAFPYTLVYSYVEERNGLLFYPYWTPQETEDVAVQYASLKVLAPSGMKVRYRENMLDESVSVSQAGEQTSYFWEISNRKAIRKEPYGPPFDLQTPSVRLAPSEFEFGGYRGNMSTWEDLGVFFAKLNEGRDVLPPELAGKVTEMVKDAASPEEKVRILYEYMQKSTRYVSVQLNIGGFQTYDAAYVYTNGYGDCKALTNYMMSMLKHTGIPSYPALVRAGVGTPDITTDFPSDQFNHVILCIPLAADTLWLECTSSENASGYLGSFTEDRHVLLTGLNNSKLIRTHFRRPEENLQFREADIFINPDGSARIRYSITASGHQQDAMQQVDHGLAAKEKEDWVRRQIPLSSYELVKWELKPLSGGFNPVSRLDIEMNARNCATLSNKRLFLNLNLLSPPMSVPEASATPRTQPVWWNSTFLDKDSINFHIPAGYAPEGIPPAADLSSDFGEYHSAVQTPDEQTLIYLRSLRMERTQVPAPVYDSLREFLRQVVKADKVQAVMNGKS
ncbi:MAG: DUF3857 domain-containing protein [Bacteroidetes bacterium]|nr:MAG: DUF3857 domain-containing protein [Bacteroidota bacterium]